VEPNTLSVVVILFLAVLTRSTFGFGEALVAMPLLALLVPLELAAPLVALLSATTSAAVLFQDWRNVHARAAGWLIASSLLGIPLGLLLLKHADERLVKAVLAVVILGFSAFCQFGRRPFVLKSDGSAWLFGLCAGVLGGAYNTHGPPLVIYATLRQWSAEYFRATLQGYALPVGLIVLISHGLAGLWVPPVFHYYVASLPAVFAAVLLGRVLNRRLAGPGFLQAVHILLIVLGAMLLVQCLVSVG
jgi:uncharacterized membrane protein YfcA